MRSRPVEHADAEALMAIYNPEVAASTVSFDLVERTLESQLAWIDAHTGPHQAIVAVDEDPALGVAGARGETVVGFASLSPFRERPAYATTVENSLYVHPSARRRGVGRFLLLELLEVARDHGFHSVIARITGQNEGSIELHRSCGFELVGIEREVGRKHNRWLDVVEMQVLL